MNPLVYAGSGTIDLYRGDVHSITPTGDMTINAPRIVPGQILVFVITTSGASSHTLTFGTGFKSTGTLATGTDDGKVFTIAFVGDGINYNEISRTVAM